MDERTFRLRVLSLLECLGRETLTELSVLNPGADWWGDQWLTWVEELGEEVADGACMPIMQPVSVPTGNGNGESNGGGVECRSG